MWVEENNALCKEFTFANFQQAFGFMSQVAIAAEVMNHHPWWSNVWNTVHFRLNTHDAGDIVTEKDHALAAKIDEIYNSYK